MLNKPDLAALFLRLGAGGTMLLMHGWPKLMGFAQRFNSFPDPLGVSSPVSYSLTIFAEVFCAALIVAGVATRLAAIPLLVTMLVAAFVVHGADPFAKKELALLYGTCFATLIFSGSGKYRLQTTVLARLDRWS